MTRSGASRSEQSVELLGVQPLQPRCGRLVSPHPSQRSPGPFPVPALPYSTLPSCNAVRSRCTACRGAARCPRSSRRRCRQPESRPSVRRRQVGAPPGRGPWARIATTRTENSEGIQNRRSTTSNTERTKGTDTRERRARRVARGHVEEGVEMARRDGVDHVLRTMPRGWHPTGNLWRRTSSWSVRLGNVEHRTFVVGDPPGPGATTGTAATGNDSTRGQEADTP